MITRGQLVVVALQGDYGKPRPALVIQAAIGTDLASVVVCPLTTTIRDDAPHIRLMIEPSQGNGLHQSSQIMIDKISAVPKGRVGQTLGVAEDRIMQDVTRALAILLGIV